MEVAIDRLKSRNNPAIIRQLKETNWEQKWRKMHIDQTLLWDTTIPHP